MKKILAISIIILTIVWFILYPTASKTFNLAAGFTAKNICSGHFISHFKVEDIAAQELNPLSPAFGIVSYDVDETNQVVDTDVAGFFHRRASYRDGLGCTLHAIGQDSLTTSVTPLATVIESDVIEWPDGIAEVNNSQSQVNKELLEKAIDDAFSEDFSQTKSDNKRNVKAVLVIHKGKLIAERYSADVNKKTPLLSWSTAKSITSLQASLLIKEGKLNLFKPARVPQWKEPTDPRHGITLDQLMRMSSGLEFNESYGINTDVSLMLSNEPDAGNYAASKTLEHPIDTHWSYSSGTTNIISGIIKRTIGGSFQDYYEYTQNKLFRPLGIYSAISETDASDHFIGSSYFYASARDWAKLGQLMMQNGKWKGVQILPENWVQYSSTATKTNLNNSYGAQFWLNRDPEDQSLTRFWPSVPDDTYYMGGFQGQYVVMIPSENIIVLRFGFSNSGVDRGMNKLISTVIEATEDN